MPPSGTQLTAGGGIVGGGITSQPPFLPLLAARVASVREQLEAIDAGTFPRGPHLKKEVESWEQCVDWRTTAPPASACYQNCFYEGCATLGLAITGFCDETTASCFLGELDRQCEGIADGERYEGMATREDGSETFCSSAGGFPAKVSFCPPPPNIEGGGPETGVNSTSGAYQYFQSLCVSLLLVVSFIYTF